MMKVYKKCIVAELIDTFIHLALVIELREKFPIIFKDKDWIFYFLYVILPLYFTEFTFKGASIGMAIMRIRVYDKNWQKPSYSILLQRHCLVNRLRFIKYDPYYPSLSVMDVIDEERDKLGTRVIDKKVFKRLNNEAKSLPGDWAENMSKLYDAYLRKLYLKE